VPAEAGVAFASDDVVIDQRGSDAACQVPVHLEYRYDPRANTLELQRPVVHIDIVDGHCVPRSHETTIEKLVRVDEAHETIELPAPRGNPVVQKNPPRQPPRKHPTPAYTTNAPSTPNQQILPQPQANVPVQQAGPPEIQQAQKQ
jgi:hypothetical protein